jgi:heme/copper-type cytochrome/quinol oxidase subunit 2
MTSRRSLGLLLMAIGASVVAAPFVSRLASAGLRTAAAQERAPNRREFSLTAKDFRFAPDRLEVTQHDLVKLTIRSEDVAYGFTIDQYRVSKRIPAGGSVTFEFLADSAPGTFPFYSNMTSDPRHGQMRGQLIVRPR